MAYKKQNFSDGKILTAAHLNHIEDGIVDIVGAIEDIPYTLSQGYATDKDLNNNQANRVKTTFIHGSFTIKLNEGYVIRAIYTYASESVTDSPAMIMSNGTSLTEYNLQNEGRCAIVTLAKAGDGTANLSYTESIIKSLTTIESGNNSASTGGGCGVIKRAVFFGDSITHGVYSYFENGNRKNGFDSDSNTHLRIPDYFGQLAGCYVLNQGKRGSGWVADNRNLGDGVEMTNATDFSQFDFAAYCLGINDYIQGKPLGDLETKATGTVVGNMVTCFNKIFAENPLCKVVVYSPYNAWGQESTGGDYVSNEHYGDESTNYALGYQGKGGYTLQDLIDKIDEVCKFYGIRHVKLSESNVCNRFTIKNIMIDGLHPSRESRPFLAAEIFGQKGFDR